MVKTLLGYPLEHVRVPQKLGINQRMKLKQESEQPEPLGVGG
jgi:hypothetical protein